MATNGSSIQLENLTRYDVVRVISELKTEGIDYTNKVQHITIQIQ